MELHSEAHKVSIKRFETLEQDFIDIHQGKFNYDEVVFKSMKDKIKIKCNTCNNFFEQRAGSHLQGFGCKFCQVEKSKIRNKLKPEEYFSRLFSKHPEFENWFDYSLFDYKKAHSHTYVKCIKHNLTFKIKPTDHMGTSNGGCKECIKESLRISKDIYFSRLFSNFPENKEKYIYLNDYTRYDDLLKIKCTTCDNVFEQKAEVHLRGSGCNKCARNKTQYIIYKNQRTILYYVKLNDLYKIGLTKSSVSSRYSGNFIKPNVKLEILFEKEFEDGYQAYLIEQKVLNEANFGFILKEESPINGGYTEIRTINFIDILNKNII